MSGFPHRDSRCSGNAEFMLTSKNHIKDFSFIEKKTGPTLQTHSLREFEKHLKDLKKENFSLKLRIYFLEEKIQQKFDDRSSEDIHRKNIELKVEVESLKQELYERQQLFDQELLIEELKASVSSKEEQVASLNKEKDSLNQKVTQLEKELQKLVGEQQAQLVQYENAAGQRVKDLQTSEQQVQVLQTKIMQSDETNKELQQRLNEMHHELLSAQETAQQRESAMQMLNISLNGRDEEVADLKQLNEKQKELLVSLKKLNDHHQLQQHQMSGSTISQSQVEITRLQTSIFSTQLELQTSQRAQQQALIKGEDLVFRNRCLQSDLQQEIHHRQEAEKHNQGLLTALQRAQSDLDQIEEKWQKELEKRMQEVKDKEISIREMRMALQHKEGLLHDYYTLQKEPAGTQDTLIHRLRLLIQERDQALERAVEETFVFTVQKENEVHKLQQLLQESEKALRKLRCVLENNEETIKSLELLVRSKTLELEQVNEAWRGSQRVQSQYVDQQACSLTEKDSLISKLQTALDTHVKKSEDLTLILLSNVEFSSDEVAEELKAQLYLKDRLFQDLLAVHTRQAQEHDLHIQELLKMMHTRERYIKDSAERAGRIVAEQAARLQQTHRPEVTADTKNKPQLLYSKKREHSILHPSLPTNQETLQTQVSLKHKVFTAGPSSVETEQVAVSQTDNEGRSMMVQVDLQDLGYETCGRSENEAERDDTSSPEFDDLELCTSLSCQDTSQLWSGLGLVNKDKGDVAFLQQQVEDLQMQLSRSQTLVFSLQDRIKDVPPASMPSKVNQADKQLQGLLTRVSSIEEQLGKGKSHTEEEDKKSSWSSKFDTLIQTQARELSQLRQKMQEGRSMCYVLKQHLGDTTKAFEELLRANDIDYYMGQCFRDQLAQSSALAQRVGAKLSNREYFEVPGDKKGDERLSVWLNKEHEQKDKLIQLLHSKLEQQQSRPDSPASGHASSKSTDQSSDRASFVMAEQGSSGDDLDLCSELDTASQFDLEEHRDLSPAASACNQNFASEVTSSPPSLPLAHGNQFFGSSPIMHCIPFFEGQTLTDLGSTNFKPISGFSPGCSIQTHHVIQQSPLYSPNISSALKPGNEVLEKNSWNMSHGVQSKEESTFGHLIPNLQDSQSGINHREKDLMKEHLREVRSLCQSLADSVHANDRLRQKLEERLGVMGNKTGSPANTPFNAEMLDTVSQLSKEIKVLKEERLVLQTQFQQASREVEVLRKTVLLECSRFKQAEMEAENWKEQFRQLQVKLRESTQETQLLRHDKQIHREHTNRLQHEVNVLQQQLNENSQLVNKLQGKLQEYQRIFDAKSKLTGFDPQEHPTHVGLLEQQLSERLKHKASHTSARIKLFHDPSHSPPVRDPGFSSLASSASVEEPTATYHNCDEDFPRPCSREAKAPDGSFGNKARSHVVGHWEDYGVLKQKVLEGEVLICRMEATLQSGMEFNMFEDCVSNCLSNTKAFKLILKKMGSVLKMFWRESATCPEKQLLKEEVLCLRHKLSVQEQTLRDTVENLRDSNCTKANMEQLIHDQLLRTREVLKKARTNLEIKCQATPAVSLVDEI